MTTLYDPTAVGLAGPVAWGAAEWTAFGSVVGGLGSVTAVIAAFLLLRHEIRAQWSTRNQAARHQAERVAGWIATTEVDGGGSSSKTRLIISNASDQPVWAVTARLVVRAECQRTGASGDEPGKAPFPYFDPPEELQGENWVSALVHVGVVGPHERIEEPVEWAAPLRRYPVGLYFDDDADQSWWRDWTGGLRT